MGAYLTIEKIAENVNKQVIHPVKLYFFEYAGYIGPHKYYIWDGTWLKPDVANYIEVTYIGYIDYISIVDAKKPSECNIPTDYACKPEEALEKKKKKYNNPNLTIINAANCEIQIDYDCEEIPEQFHKVLGILRQRFPKGHLNWKKYLSASGKHFHIIVTLPEEITNQERILWQAVFGSDYMRESLNVLRLSQGFENPVKLFMDPTKEPERIVEVPERPNRKFKELPKETSDATLA